MAGFSPHRGREAPPNTACRLRQSVLHGLVILFDIEKIEPIAIMNDGVIQKFRVAALSAVAAKYLAPDKPKVLGLFGTGWQASAHPRVSLAVNSALSKSRSTVRIRRICREFCETMTAKLGMPHLCFRHSERNGRGK